MSHVHGVQAPVGSSPFQELQRLRSGTPPKTTGVEKAPDRKEVRERVDKAKSFEAPNLLTASLKEKKLTSGKMELLDQGLETLGIEKMQSNAAKLSKPSTWGKALGNILFAGSKKVVGMVAQAGLTAGQYLGHLLGLTVNAGIYACYRFNLRGINRELSQVNPLIQRLDQQFDQLQQELESRMMHNTGLQMSGGSFDDRATEVKTMAKQLVTSLKMSPLDGHLQSHLEEKLHQKLAQQAETNMHVTPQQAQKYAKTQVDYMMRELKNLPIFTEDRSELQATARNLGGKASKAAASYYNLKDIQGKLTNEKFMLQGNHTLAQRKVHATIKNYSWAASRRIDEGLGMREKSIRADKTWDYLNMPDLADSMVGNLSNGRSLAGISLNLAGLSHSTGGTLVGEAAGPMLIIGETVGLGADIYTTGKTGLRLHRLDKFEDKFETGQLQIEHTKVKGSQATGENLKDALSLMRKNTKQILKTRIFSGLKHTAVLGTIGTLVGLGLLTAGTILTGGGLMVAIGIGAGVAYGGIALHRAYKQHMRVQNIDKMEQAHGRVQAKIDLLESALKHTDPHSTEHVEITQALQKFRGMKGALESSLRQTSSQHAAMGIIADLMSQNPDGSPTDKARVAHKALLKTGFEFPLHILGNLQTRDTQHIQHYLETNGGDNPQMSELRLALVQSLEQFVS